MNPKYSVVIPVYNRPDEVDELLQSLCGQTYQNFEVVVVEDGSAIPCKQVVEKYAEMLYKLIGRGFSAGVYTQTTDVEMEVNGLMTYDRKEMKVEPERIRKINQKLCNALSK